jgi:hypothetical protein
MKYVVLPLLCVVAIVLTACGGGNSTTNSSQLSGNWSATLTDGKGSTIVGFNVTFTEGSSTVVGVANMTFTTTSSCLAVIMSPPTAALGTGNSFQMNILSGTTNLNGSNQMTLQGTPSSTTINGTWNLSGSGMGCTDNDVFTMFKM